MLLQTVKQQLRDRWQAHIASISSNTDTIISFRKQLADQVLEIADTVNAGTNYGFDKIEETNQTYACCITTQNATRMLADDFKGYLKEYLCNQSIEQLSDLTTQFKIRYLIADYHTRQIQNKDGFVSVVSDVCAAAPLAYTPAALMAIAEDNASVSVAAIALQLLHTGFNFFYRPLENYRNTVSSIARETERWKDLMSELHDMCLEEQIDRQNRKKETDENV